MSIFDILTPGAVAQDPHDRWRWATVTATSPLTIRFDGDITETHPTSTLVNGLAVGNRVWCQLFGQRIVVLGVGGGGSGSGGLSVASITVNRILMTVNGNYVKPAGLLYADVEVQGDGAAGGGRTQVANQVSIGGGGGGGGYRRALIPAASIPTTVPVTVGQGGIGSGSAAKGGDGTGSSFGTLVEGHGGIGGARTNGANNATVQAAGGAGGDTGGTWPSALSVNGQDGGIGRSPYNSAVGGTTQYGYAVPGSGGDSFLGHGAAEPGIGQSGFSASGTPWGGGSSGLFGMNQPVAAAQNGEPGVVIITEYISTFVPPPELSAAYPATPNTLALRNGNGNTQVAWPVANEDAVPKAYADALLADTGDVSSGVVTALTNWTITNVKARKIGPFCSIWMTVEYTGPSFSTGTSGNITNMNVGTVDSAFRPIGNSAQLNTLASGGLASFSVNTLGELSLNALPGGLTIASNTAWAIGGMYMATPGPAAAAIIPWTPLLLHANVVPYLPGTAPRYKVVGDTVTISGVVKPATAAAANALQTVGGMTIAFLPPEITPEDDALALFGAQKGPGNNSWFTSLQGVNTFTASRYGPNNPDTTTWLPFSLTYLL